MTATDWMAVILARFSSFSQIVRALIATKFASTFCYLKANLTSIYSYVKAKKWGFPN